MAETLEQSDHSSAQCRINALRSARLAEDGPTSEGSADLSKPVAGDRQRVADAFLSPIDLRESSGETGLWVSTTGKRCSDKGFLPMSTQTYLELLDWTVREGVLGKRGRTSSEVPPILRRLGLSPSVWNELVGNFGRLFPTMAGLPHRIDSQRSLKTGRRYQVRSQTRQLFQQAA